MAKQNQVVVVENKGGSSGKIPYGETAGTIFVHVPKGTTTNTK